jgi:hypothetical protein
LGAISFVFFRAISITFFGKFFDDVLETFDTFKVVSLSEL